MKKYIIFILNSLFLISSLIFIDSRQAILIGLLLCSILIFENIFLSLIPSVMIFFIPLEYLPVLIGIMIINFSSYKLIKRNRFISLSIFCINILIINFVYTFMNVWEINILLSSLLLLLIYGFINCFYIYYKDNNNYYTINKNPKIIMFFILIGYLIIFKINNVNVYLYYFLFMQTFLLKDIKFNLILSVIFGIFLFKTQEFNILLNSISISFFPLSIVFLLDFSNILFIILLIYSILVSLSYFIKDTNVTIENDYINSLFCDFNKYVDILNNEYNKCVYIKEVKDIKIDEFMNNHCDHCNNGSICNIKMDKRYTFLSSIINGSNINIYNCPFIEDAKTNINYNSIQKSYEYSGIKMLAFELSTLYNQSLTNKSEYEKFIKMLNNYQYHLTNLKIDYTSSSINFSFKINSTIPPLTSLIRKVAYTCFGEILDIKVIGDIYHLYKHPRISISYAHTIIAKDGNLMSGDNYYIKKQNNSNYVFALSDGVGSGYNAYLESSDVLRIIKELLSYNFRLNTILKMIEDIYDMRANYDRYATLDLLKIDSANNKAILYKMGSTTTYLFHNKQLIAYQNKALPLKIDELNSYYEFELNKGDLILMVSDGITDFINSDEMYKLINVEKTPEEICNNIIEFLKKKENNTLKDDLSLIVIKSI